MKRQASPEAKARMEEADRREGWSAICRYCGASVKGTPAELQETAKRHGPGVCKEQPNGA